MSNSQAKVKSVLLRHLLTIVDYMMAHDCTPESREQYINDSIADLVSELLPFLDLPLLWRPMAELKGAARTIITAAPDALTRCHHFNPDAAKIKRPGFQPTHFCEVPPGAPNAAGY